MSRRKKSYFLFFVLSLLCIVTAELSQSLLNKSEKEIVAAAQQHLNILENQIQQSLSAIGSFHALEQCHKFCIHRDQQNLGFSFFYFENGVPVYWSDNETSFSSALSDSIINGSVLHLPNGIYEAFVKEAGHKRIIGLILLKKEYAYENKYLVNAFNPRLGLGTEATLANEDAAAYPIYSSSGRKLFSVSFSHDSSAENTFNVYAVLYLAAFLFLLTGVFFLVIAQTPISIYTVVVVSLFLAGLRAAMIAFRLPVELYRADFFSPKYYASSLAFNSLGDLLLNSLTLFCIATIISFWAKSLRHKESSGRSLGTVLRVVVSALVIVALTIFIHKLISGLIVNSKISFDVSDLPDLDGNSIIGLFSAMLLLWGWYLLFNVLLLKPFFQKIGRDMSRFRPDLLFLLFFSVYTSYIIVSYANQKKQENQKTFAQRLDLRQDHMAEFLFEDVEKRISHDPDILHSFSHHKTINAEIIKRLQQEYFNGYWNKFYIAAWCYNEMDSAFDSGSSPEMRNLRSQAEQQGKETISEKMFFLPGESGRLSYLALLPMYLIGTDSLKIGTIAIRFDSRIFQPAEGFPELFVSSRVTENRAESNYSYARYKNDSLIYTGGNYPYAFTSGAFVNAGKEFSFLRLDDYDHLLYKSSPSTLIIVSRPADSVFNTVSLFSYVLLFYSFFFFITTGIVFLASKENRNQMSLKQRVRLSVIALVTFSFILIVTGTVVYIIGKYDKDQDRNILARLYSLWSVMNDKVNFQSPLSAVNYEEYSVPMNEMADDLNADFNLYDEKGNLFYSSQGKIFDDGILSTHIDPEAFFEMNRNSRTQYVHRENVGRLDYIAAYSPFTDKGGRVTGYLNLPYFEKQNELKKEISGFMSALINIYVLLFVIAVFLALFISSRITQPLLLIQEKLRNIRLERKNESIEWRRNDEIGELVQEYNRMVSELEASAEQLARSERESAWREMAQQVAHEIKNPLTPMKLSVQHLQIAWHEKRGNLDELFERISKTLIEQINALSNIATEFGNFAKMPKAIVERFELSDVIHSAINLFESTPDLRIVYEVDSVSGKVLADREQIVRVFSNLIKNAMQSIPKDRIGEIRIGVKAENNSFIILVTDNGAGIAQGFQSKIFIPSFTTKTSGMGLGLSITKSIVEAAGGKIWFETEEGKGTTFFVILPAGN